MLPCGEGLKRDGAVDIGIADRTGSLTPVKRADLILVRTGDINMAMSSDPYEALVTFAQPRNIDTVIVDGRVLRRAKRQETRRFAQYESKITSK